MSEERINPWNSLEEQLVAYLDGELDAQSSRQIEELLASDPEVRLKLQRLERTWELLDELETTPAGEKFTRTTLEMVALAAQEDVQKTLDEAPRRRRRRWLVGGVGLLAAGLAGFLAITLPMRDPNRRLLQDLPVLEYLDEYSHIQDIQFLRLLQKEGRFGREEVSGADLKSAVRTEAELEGYIKRLSPSEQVELLRKEERFAGLELAVQDRLRDRKSTRLNSS